MRWRAKMYQHLQIKIWQCHAIYLATYKLWFVNGVPCEIFVRLHLDPNDLADNLLAGPHGTNVFEQEV